MSDADGKVIAESKTPSTYLNHFFWPMTKYFLCSTSHIIIITKRRSTRIVVMEAGIRLIVIIVISLDNLR